MLTQGETVVNSAYDCVLGGRGAGQAFAARRAWAPVRLIEAVGLHTFAEVAVATLREAGIETSSVVRTGLPSGAAFINVDYEARNAITVAVGANVAADGEAIRCLKFEMRDILLLQREVSDVAGEIAARTASTAGDRMVLNLAPSGPVAESYVSLIDIHVMNDHEVADLAVGLATEKGWPLPVPMSQTRSDRDFSSIPR